MNSSSSFVSQYSVKNYEELKSHISPATRAIISQIKADDLRTAPSPEVLSQTLPLDPKSSNSDNKISLPMNTIAKSISKNKQISPLSQSLCKRKLPLNSAVAQVLRMIPEDTIGIYSIRSNTYNEIIEIPVRCAKCTHYDVVDLEFFIRTASVEDWKCPICHKHVRLDTLCVDHALQEELESIKDLRPIEQPDWLFYSKTLGKFIRARNSTFIEDIRKRAIDLGLPGDFTNCIIDSANTPMYNFADQWMTPDKQRFEILFDLIKPNSPMKPKEASALCLIPVIIIGDLQNVAQIRSELSKLEFKHFTAQFVTFAPSYYNCGFSTKLRIMKLLLGLNSFFKVVILADRKNMDEVKAYIECHDLLHETEIRLIYPSEIVLESPKKGAPQMIQSPKIEEIAEIIKKQCEDSFMKEGMEEEANEEERAKKFQSLFKEPFEIAFEFKSSRVRTLNNMEIIRGENGVLLTIPIEPTKDLVASYQTIQFTNSTTEEESHKNLYKIRVARSALDALNSSECLLIYCPDAKAATGWKSGVTSKFVTILGPEVINPETVVLPMLLSDYVAIYYDGKQDNIIRSIISAKEANPCLMSKAVFICTDKELTEVIDKILIDPSEREFLTPLAKPETKRLQWRLSLWFLNLEQPNDIPNLHEKLKFDLSALTNFKKNASSFCGSKHNPQKLLAKAIRGRLSALESKKVDVAKEETTIEEIVFAAAITPRKQSR
eukprot:TRINITY_DN105897_c0_g1_i1.p1 TRINITY_DN105897_c0_g1~~TRINITY_DN105897_c0_g1_i1.p1  ORF type:complete len:718 (+),score=72.25 TRINITY_DN105897_c0_g1_i1:178-2331(+)